MFQETLPALKCYTKVSKVRLSGSVYNTPPKFIQQLHQECLEKALQDSVQETEASEDQCRVWVLDCC
jgi:hypothetical protein